MNASPKKNLRKKLLIDPAFQNSFLAYTVGTALSVVSVFFVALRVFFWKLEAKGAAIGLPSDHIFFQFVREQRWTMDVIFLLTACVIVGILISTGLHLSNRIAGPIYRAKKYLRERKEGKESGLLKFRDKDYFQELATSINAALEAENGSKSDRSDKAAG